MPIPKEILIINLDRRPDRLYRLLSELETSDLAAIPISRLSARDGKTLALGELLSSNAKKEMVDLHNTGLRTFHAQLSVGAVGCYLSHVDAWRHIVESALKDGDMDSPTIVMEDDAIVPPTTEYRVDYAWRAALKRAQDKPVLAALHLICLNERKTHEDGLIEPGAFFGTTAYMVNGTTALSLLNSPLFPVDSQIDCELRYIRNRGDLAIFYFPCITTPSTSDTDIQVNIHPNAPLDRH